MGYMRHHAIIVSGEGAMEPRKSWLEQAHARACELFPWVSPISPPTDPNAYSSFFIPPDGSKEGWEESDRGDMARAAFLEYLKAEHRAWHFFKWVEVQYGDGDGEAKVCDASDWIPSEE
jgi:hypothetical protein